MDVAADHEDNHANAMIWAESLFLVQHGHRPANGDGYLGDVVGPAFQELQALLIILEVQMLDVRRLVGHVGSLREGGHAASASPSTTSISFSAHSAISDTPWSSSSTAAARAGSASSAAGPIWPSVSAAVWRS